MEALRNAWKGVQDFCAPIGNLASVAGLLVSVVGFYFTIRSVITAKQAARLAQRAADDAKQSILRAGAIAKFSTAIGLMEEIRKLQRRQEWHAALDKYSELRRVMVELQSEPIGLIQAERGVLITAMAQFDIIENKIEQTVSDKKTAPDVPRMNDIISQQIKRVHLVSAKFRVQ